MTLLTEVQECIDNNDLSFLWRKDVDYLEDEVIDEGRWTITHRVVLGKNGIYVAVQYDTGATEYQDDTELNGIAYYVKPVEVMVIKYERI